MDERFFYSFAAIAVKEIAPGFMSKLIHTDNNTINFIEVKQAAPFQHTNMYMSSCLLYWKDNLN